MTARQKIEGLTNAWYGFALVSGLASLVQNGIGVFSIALTTGSILFSFVLTWFLGRRLLARSSLWRTILLVVSGLGTVLFTLGAARLAWAFVHAWSLSLLVGALGSGVLVYMYGRSFRVLTDRDVKAYFG